jgi:hypothetical protein
MKKIFFLIFVLSSCNSINEIEISDVSSFDHDNFGLQNPAYFNPTYNWLKAIDQNPNINIHIYSNEKENYIQYKRGM